MAASIVAILIVARPNWRETLLTAELRRRLTKLLATANFALLIVLLVALLDSFGAWLAYLYRHGQPGTRWHALVALIAPAAAFLLKKLPEWAEGTGKSGIMARLGASCRCLRSSPA